MLKVMTNYTIVIRYAGEETIDVEASDKEAAIAAGIRKFDAIGTRRKVLGWYIKENEPCK